MAKKTTKMISVNEMENYMDSSVQKEDTENWKGMELTIKMFLPLMDMMEFVDSVYQCCFADDGTYRPELKDFAVRKYVVEMYSNVRLPKDVGKQYEVLILSGVFDQILTKINFQQYNSMLMAVEQKIAQHLADANTNAQIGITKLTNDFNNAVGQLSETLDGIAPEDIQKIAGAVGDGKVDEGALMKAYLAERKEVTEDVSTE